MEEIQRYKRSWLRLKGWPKKRTFFANSIAETKRILGGHHNVDFLVVISSKFTTKLKAVEILVGNLTRTRPNTEVMEIWMPPNKKGCEMRSLSEELRIRNRPDQYKDVVIGSESVPKNTERSAVEWWVASVRGQPGLDKFKKLRAKGLDEIKAGRRAVKETPFQERCERFAF